jgi:hypothetical protein
MEPKISPDGTCEKDCPYFKPFTHPFYCHTVWCMHQFKLLSWYDGAHIASCDIEPPDEKLANLVKAGWKGNPDYER